MPRSALVVQHLGDDELWPGTTPFTSIEVAVVSTTENVSETPRGQVVICLNEIQVKENPSAFIWLVPLVWLCVSEQHHHFSYQQRAFL